MARKQKDGAKLNLFIDKLAREALERLAVERNTSLSKMVEELVLKADALEGRGGKGKGG